MGKTVYPNDMAIAGIKRDDGIGAGHLALAYTAKEVLIIGV